MTTKKKAVDFEAGLAALETLVSKMENEMPLEESLAAYEEGVKLHAALAAQLDASIKRMRIVSGTEDDE